MCRGVHGPLIDLFECHENLYTAVEVTAGNQLFNVVVDTDTTASNIYRLLSQHKAGRITCLPINRLHVGGAHASCLTLLRVMRNDQYFAHSMPLS